MYLACPTHFVKRSFQNTILELSMVCFRGRKQRDCLPLKRGPIVTQIGFGIFNFHYLVGILRDQIYVSKYWLLCGYILTSNSGCLDGGIHILIDCNGSLVLSHWTYYDVTGVGQIYHTSRRRLQVVVVAGIASRTRCRSRGRSWCLVVAVTTGHVRHSMVLVEAIISGLNAHQCVCYGFR